MISVLIVCRQIDKNLIRTIKSVKDLHPQLLIGISKHNISLGVRKNDLIRVAAFDWVLILDTDEVVSKELIQSINKVISLNQNGLCGYSIKYQNYIFGKPVNFGGEKYSRKQLFKRQFGKFTTTSIHEYPQISGDTDELKGVIHHYSYVSLPKVLKKFTKYAWQMAGEKRKVHEGVTPKKLFLYGPHMVWARAVKDEGWRDGWRGIVIALCFGYMETLIYWFLLIKIVLHFP